VGVETAFDIEVDIDKMQGFVTIEDFVSHIESFSR
jgi:acyl carrier protein